jgi:hypothetical protein
LVNVTDSGTIGTTQYFDILENAYMNAYGGSNQSAGWLA